ncbi:MULTISPECIES: ABC transporter substrate-binding protein [unclassified Blastococcus]|uniref:ABC transporter substrate-binding protein n=1 Tax=unclassified Blastococcus TaxID=2619396 RepID=UPI001EF0F177|nr:MULTISPECIES: ABC transporter substrate-binding protein [unclassified Blastococcus]
MSGPRRRVGFAALCAGALALTACGGDAEGTGATAGDLPETLVVDKAFDLKTADPGRQFEVAGTIVGRALYETLVTFEDGDLSEVAPALATEWTVNDDATEYTFTLEEGVTFADGSPLDSDDVVFSINRVKNLKGNGSFLVEGITAEADGPGTVVLRSEQPNPQLLRILPRPSLGILNADAVRENGGTDAPDAAETDTAEEFLNSQSVGTGPYVLDQFSTSTETVLAANPDYRGEAPPFQRIVLRNVEGPTQAMNVQSGQSHIALDLASEQLAGLRGDPNLLIDEVASPNIWFTFANADPAVSEITSSPDFREAVRYGIDYDGLLEIAGDGAVRVPGIIPNVFFGALDQDQAPQRDVERAKAAVERLGGPVTVELEYPSDFSANGLSFGPVAERLQAGLAEVGVNLELKPGPIATTLETYRNGQEQMGLWLWAPDYPDPADYLAFGPGELVGKRAGWQAGAAPEIERVMAEVAGESDDERRAVLFEEFQQLMNEEGVMFPVFQPTAAVVASADIGAVPFHPAWTLDLTAIGR